MPHKKFKINDDQDQLVLSWGFFWNNMKISFNGEYVEFIKNKRDLRIGHDVTLPNGAILSLKLVKQWYNQKNELHLSIDGKPLKGTMADPGTIIRRVFRFMLTIGLLSVVSGLLELSIAELVDSPEGLLLPEHERKQLLGLRTIGYVNLGIGSVFAVLAIAVRKFSLRAVYAGMAMLVVSIALRIFIATPESEASSARFGMVIRLLYLAFLWRAATAIKEINDGTEAEQAMAPESLPQNITADK